MMKARKVKYPPVREDEVLVTLYDSIIDNADDSEWKRSMLGALRARHWKTIHQLIGCSPFVEQGTLAAFRLQAQLVALTRKYPFPEKDFPGVNREAAAMEKFMKAEQRMKRVNLRLRSLRAGLNQGNLMGLPVSYARYIPKLEKARRYISWVLGENPDLNAIYDKCDWSAGASVGVHGDATNWGRKALAVEWTCTPGALPYFRAAVKRNFHLAELLCEEKSGVICLDPDVMGQAIDGKVRFVDTNLICCVPKDFNCDRTIAIEPTLNNFLQKGVDLEMRKLLLRASLDLTDQTRNQALARMGSKNGFYATLDLSSASDTLSLELCRYLLPEQWFGLLNCLRSPGYSVCDSAHRYEKFVSMGNGFCFPLETLIFAALVHACGVSDAERAVYGDDIVVPASNALELAELLRFAGFSLNKSKSFLFGPFRESCGADWYEGRDVRPVYVTERVDNISSLFTLHNSLARSDWTKVLFGDCQRRLREMLPPSLRYVHCGERLGTVLNGSFNVSFDDILSSSLTIPVRDLTGRFSGPILLDGAVRDKGEGSAHAAWSKCEYIAVLRGSSSQEPLAFRNITRHRLKRRLVA